MEQANSWREREKNAKDAHLKDIYAALATEMFTVAANLEFTEEINPTKITLHTSFVGGMPIGEIVARDGQKWKVIDNYSTIITTAELVK